MKTVNQKDNLKSSSSKMAFSRVYSSAEAQPPYYLILAPPAATVGTLFVNFKELYKCKGGMHAFFYGK